MIIIKFQIKTPFKLYNLVFTHFLVEIADFLLGLAAVNLNGSE
jgi:hypothetical protein